MSWYEQFKLEKWLNVVWQAKCPLCQRSTPQVVCLDCDRQLQACRLPKPYSVVQELPLFAWGTYDGALKRAIAVCKYQNHPELAEMLGQSMAKVWLATPPPGLLRQSLVIPIPLHAAKLKTRGFNQAEVLARNFAEGAKLPWQSQLLIRVKDTKPQIQTRNKQEREANLQNAFAIQRDIRQKIKHKSVLLVDDIYTSGSTIRSAIAALKSVNLEVGGIVVLAKGLI